MFATAGRKWRICCAVLATCLFIFAGADRQANANQDRSDRSSLDSKPLPWERKRHEKDLPPPEITGPRALLDLLGIDASQLASLQNGQPLGPNDEETLVKILFRLPAFPPDAEQRWCLNAPEWKRLVDSPEEHRAAMFSVNGRATRVDAVRLLPEAADRFEFATYYRVTLEIEGSPYSAIACTRVIPKAWTVGVRLQEPCRLAGLFLKVVEPVGEPTQLVFATARVAWFPDRPCEEKGVFPDHVYLASLGMDIGLFDEIRDRNRKPLGVKDRDGFYQLLVAVGKADPVELRRRANRSLDLERLLGTPAAEHGKLQTVQGLARRVTKIVLSDAGLSSRLGFDHYFQIDVFVPLGDKIIRLGESTPDREAPTFTNTYPVTACVRRLPPGLSEGADIRREIRIPAVYFKLWSYHSEFVSAYDDRQMQLGPMLIGLEPEIVPKKRASSPYVGLAAGLIAIAAMAGIWYGLWRWNRSDRPVSFTVPRQTLILPAREGNEKTED
ncbi:MAG: hypothetical protein ACC628_00820 [Pirellulaceae bacterium]